MSKEFLEDVNIEPSKEIENTEGSQDDNQNVEAASVESATPAEPESGENEGANKVESAKWAAVSDERKKRREANERADKFAQEAAYLRGQIEALKTGNQPSIEEPSVDDLDNEFLISPSQALKKHGDKIRGEYENRIRTMGLNMGERLMRSKHDDYDSMIEVFKGLVAKDPTLAANLNAHPDPMAIPELAYQYAKRAKVDGLIRESNGSYEELEKKLREQIRKELLEEGRQGGALEAAATTKTLANAQGVGGMTKVSKAKSISDLFDNNPF